MSKPFDTVFQGAFGSGLPNTANNSGGGDTSLGTTVADFHANQRNQSDLVDVYYRDGKPAGKMTHEAFQRFAMNYYGAYIG